MACAKRGENQTTTITWGEKSPFALLLWWPPPELCAHIQTWANSGMHLTSPLPSQTATKPTRALLCGQASLFTRRSLCVSLCVDSSCFQGVRLCAGPQGSWNDAWRERSFVSLLVCVCQPLFAYLSFRSESLMISFRNREYINRPSHIHLKHCRNFISINLFSVCRRLYENWRSIRQLAWLGDFCMSAYETNLLLLSRWHYVYKIMRY